jgi:hypothetical protein
MLPFEAVTPEIDGCRASTAASARWRYRGRQWLLLPSDEGPSRNGAILAVTDKPLLPCFLVRDRGGGGGMVHFCHNSGPMVAYRSEMDYEFPTN